MPRPKRDTGSRLLARGVLRSGSQVPNDLHRPEDDAVEPGVNGA